MLLDRRNFRKGNPELDATLYQEALDRKAESLNLCIEKLAELITDAKAADVELDLADLLVETANDLRARYSTDKFRHTGTIGEPGHARE